MTPDQAIFDRHVQDGRFLVGVEEGMWGLQGYTPGASTWPYALIWVAAAAKNEAPNRYYFRFHLNGYPAEAPNALPWNPDKEVLLDTTKWPRGGPVTSSIFKPAWPMGLYTPFDRAARPGHENWATEYPHYWWKATFRIDDYLQYIHRILQSSDYANNP